jgi:hypothetical protein
MVVERVQVVGKPGVQGAATMCPKHMSMIVDPTLSPDHVSLGLPRIKKRCSVLTEQNEFCRTESSMNPLATPK